MTMRANQLWQSLPLITVATIIIVGASAGAFAQGKGPGSCIALDCLYPSTKHPAPSIESGSQGLSSASFTANGPLRVSVAQDGEHYPKPNTREMDPWFEYLKHKWDANSLIITVRTKKDSAHRPKQWKINFYDEDGIRVIPETFVGEQNPYLPAGEIEVFTASLPTASVMKRVMRIVITRGEN
jgi:hypothetical protein